MTENKSVIQKMKNADYRNNVFTGSLVAGAGIVLFFNGLPTDTDCLIALVVASVAIGVIYAEKKASKKLS